MTSSFYSQTGKITYSSIFNFGGNHINKTESDLFITKSASIYQSQLKTDQKTERDERAKADSENSKSLEINITIGTDSIGDLYYHNLQSRNVICREPIYENRDLNYYIYKDTPNIKWQLFDEFKEISGYKCQKATTTFRGRNYEAWFTSEVPLSFGPWKFNGLPGLILEVYDQTGEVYFSAEHIQIPFPNAEDIVKKPAKDTTIDHREFVEKGNNNSAKISQAILARSPKGTKLLSTETKRNGIELEYQWDKE